MLPKRTKKIQLVICHTQVSPDIRRQDFWLANCKFGYGRHRIAKSAPYPPSAGAQKASLCPGRLVFKCETIVGWHPHFLSCLLLGITLATGSVWALKDHPEFKELTVHKQKPEKLLENPRNLLDYQHVWIVIPQISLPSPWMFSWLDANPRPFRNFCLVFHFLDPHHLSIPNYLSWVGYGHFLKLHIFFSGATCICTLLDRIINVACFLYCRTVLGQHFWHHTNWIISTVERGDPQKSLVFPWRHCVSCLGWCSSRAMDCRNMDGGIWPRLSPVHTWVCILWFNFQLNGFCTGFQTD